MRIGPQIPEAFCFVLLAAVGLGCDGGVHAMAVVTDDAGDGAPPTESGAPDALDAPREPCLAPATPSQAAHCGQLACCRRASVVAVAVNDNDNDYVND
jgi:hypothetical protein